MLYVSRHIHQDFTQMGIKRYLQEESALFHVHTHTHTQSENFTITPPPKTKDS